MFSGWDNFDNVRTNYVIHWANLDGHWEEYPGYVWQWLFPILTPNPNPDTTTYIPPDDSTHVNNDSTQTGGTGTGTGTTAFCFYCTTADEDIATDSCTSITSTSTADTCTIIIACCIYWTTADGDSATGCSTITTCRSATNSCTTNAAFSCNRTTTDGDSTTSSIITSTNTCRTTAAIGRDDTALNFYVTTVYSPAATNTCSSVIATGFKLTGALDNKCLAFCDEDAWIILTESLYSVLAFQNDCCISGTGDTSPLVRIVVCTIDGHIFQSYTHTISNRDLIVFSERTCKYSITRNIIFCCADIGSNGCKIDSYNSHSKGSCLIASFCSNCSRT